MTFAIAARCDATGRFGVALSTRPIGVGARCPFIAPNFGIVVTMAYTDPRLGPLGLGLLRAGYSASKVLVDQAVSWRTRAQTSGPGTTPEELIAAAHASCFAMALSGILAKAGFTPTSLEVSAQVTFEQKDGKWSITKSELDVEGNVPGIDEDAFAELASQAKQDCPVSRALANNVELSVEAALSPSVLAANAGP